MPADRTKVYVKKLNNEALPVASIRLTGAVPPGNR